jgi:hypothetical protein
VATCKCRALPAKLREGASLWWYREDHPFAHSILQWLASKKREPQSTAQSLIPLSYLLGQFEVAPAEAD